MTSRSLKARRRREGGDISMFPFLAVLICTMGALILLLIIIAHQAAAQAKREAVEVHSQRKTELVEQQEDATWRREILENSLKKTREKLASLRQKLGYLEGNASRLRSEVIDLAKMLKQLEAQSPNAQNSAKLEQQLARLQSKIVTARRKLDEEMKKTTGKSQSYAVVPYHGPNETRRHPIYIECRSDGVILQPEGIRLDESDFEGFFGPDNPLAAALRAKAAYLQQRYQFSNKVGQPYPLILVRQSGIESYGAAMEAMRSWDSEFGYELIEDDMKLDFNEPDMRLRQLVLQEIEHARTKKQILARAVPRLYSDPRFAKAGNSGGRQYYTVASGKGGIVPYRGNTDDIEPSRQRVNQGNSTRRSSGYQPESGQYGASAAGTSVGSYPPVAGKNSPANLVNPGSGHGWRPGNQAHGGATIPGANSLGQEKTDSPGALQGTSPTPNSSETPRGLGALGSPGNSGMSGGTQTNNPQAENTKPLNPQEEPHLLPPPGANNDNYYGRSYLRATRQRATGNPSGLRDTSAKGQGGQNNGNSIPTHLQGKNLRQLEEAPLPDILQQGTPSYGSSTGSTASGGSPNGNQNPSQATGGTPSPMSMAPSRSSNSTVTVQNPQAQFRPGEWQPPSTSSVTRTPREPDPFATAHRSARRPQSIAQERGKDWCLPKEAAYRVPLTRPVSVECYPDRFVFRSTRNGLNAKTIKLSSQTRSSVNEFVSTVWDRVESWGMAGQGMYWRPILSVHVHPGGEARFADLQALFHDSGFTVEQKKIARNRSNATPRRN